MRDIIILATVPIVLILCASYVAYRHSEIVVPENNITQEKYTKLITDIKSGKLIPSPSDLVSYFETAKNLDKHQNEYTNSIIKLILDISEVAIVLGVLQLLIVFRYLKSKTNEIRDAL